MIPGGYDKLPKGVRCKCPRLWKEADGSYWCCDPGWLEEDAHERHEREMRALAATNGENT